MSPVRLAEVEQRAQAATPGPWYVVGHPWGDETYAVAGHPDPHAGQPVLQWMEVMEAEETETETCDQVWARVEGEMRANLAFAAAARTDIPALCAALRIAVEALDGLDGSEHGTEVTSYALRALAAIARHVEVGT